MSSTTIQELPKGEILTSAAISDLLRLEMLRSDKPAVKYAGPNVNWYIEQALTYAEMGSAGKKPLFLLDSKDFSPELRAHLRERLDVDPSKESLHRVIEDAVFGIICRRYPSIFYKHIQAKRLQWRFV